MPKKSTSPYQVIGENSSALFTLKLHRGDGMVLLAMNWKKGKPPLDFVGFAIEYKEPKGTKFFALQNRLAFPLSDDSVNPNKLSTLRSPIQKFRWVHFPYHADLEGEFTYRVTPVFMNENDVLSYGEVQMAGIELRGETYPKELNVAFTRGFVLSQAFIDKYGPNELFSKLIPAKADDGLNFVPTHPKTKEALDWMGFEARNAILDVLDKAIEDKKAEVKVIAYDLNEPGIVSRLVKLGKRLQIIIDDSGTHGGPSSAESQAEKKLIASAGQANVKRQHMGNLQHNKSIVVNGPKAKLAVGGSTNFSWRGFFVQSNNAIIVQGAKAIKPFVDAFINYWNNSTVEAFGNTRSAQWTDLGLPSVNAKVAFSPHVKSNALLQSIASDVSNNVESSLLFSLAFLYQTPGAMKEAIIKVSKSKKTFVYGISDKKVNGVGEGLDIKTPGGKVSPVFPAALTKESTPEPFKSEPSGGKGNRMHHKFLVLDFDKPTARVYLGSYNFSNPADVKNGENLIMIKDRKIAVAYMVEALRIFDHYHFRLAQLNAEKKQTKLMLKRPPRKKGEVAWWAEDYKDAIKIRDREIFA